MAKVQCETCNRIINLPRGQLTRDFPDARKGELVPYKCPCGERFTKVLEEEQASPTTF